MGESGVLVVVATEFVFPFALDPTKTDEITKNINGENLFFLFLDGMEICFLTKQTFFD